MQYPPGRVHVRSDEGQAQQPQARQHQVQLADLPVHGRLEEEQIVPTVAVVTRRNTSRRWDGGATAEPKLLLLSIVRPLGQHLLQHPFQLDPVGGDAAVTAVATTPY